MLTVALISNGYEGIEIDALLDFENVISYEEIQSTINSVKKDYEYSYDWDMFLEGLQDAFGSRLKDIRTPSYDYAIYW